MKEIYGSDLTLKEVTAIVELLCDLNGIDYSVRIESIKNSEAFKITLSEE